MFDIKIPGGYYANGKLLNMVRMGEITGHLERQWMETAHACGSIPSFVSTLLASAFETYEGHKGDQKIIDSLSVADRRYLMLQLAIQIDGDHKWLFPVCQNCSEIFDIGINRSELPVKEAGEGFPFARVRIKGRMVTARVPNGSDQKWIALNGGKVTERDLLKRCIEEVDGKSGKEGFLDSLTDKHIAKIEKALDEVSPDVGTRLKTSCPECGYNQIVEMDLYTIKGLEKSTLYEEVHTIAMHYHWGHDEILSLPRGLRLKYLSLINRSMGRFE